jgi:hypothetical protein
MTYGEIYSIFVWKGTSFAPAHDSDLFSGNKQRAAAIALACVSAARHKAGANI